MSERLRRLAAIVKADLLIRFRRPSTIVVFLLLSAFAYLWIPDPATGRALIVIDDKRAIYNSAAIGMATASLGTIFIGLAGFYVISNAIRRDVQSRCGYVIASTTMRAPEYLLGKVFGNIVFLSTFMTGFMVSSMAMLLVRGEAPLQPVVFAKQYLLLVPPAIVFVSVVAIVFESIPFLSGKFGDVAYFFLWMGSLGVVATNIGKGGHPGWAGYFDTSGFGFLQASLKTDRLTIGATSFDPSHGVYVFGGMTVSPEWILPRLVATFAPLALIAIALLFFHRFDPARLRKAGHKESRGWMARIGALAKPMARVVYGLGVHGAGGSLLGTARADAMMSLSAFPLSIVLVAGFSIAAMATPFPQLARVVLPIAFAAAAVLIADAPAREHRSGTVGMVYASPRLKSLFVWWKFAVTLLMSAIILIGPLLRIALARPAALPALLVGVIFISAFATALGVISSNPKTFIVVFLTFWYLVVSDHGGSPGLDFAGFYGVVTPAILAAYAACAVGALVVAQIFHSARLRRAW